jgi:ubiquinone/menaquinone biosynthesis C-methylase UbiE
MKPIAEESKAKVLAIYDAAAATYNQIGPSFFLHFGGRLVGSVGIVPGSRVLDVATGTGAVLVPAAELMGPKGKVVGVDMSSAMISRAQAEIGKCRINNAYVLVADGERLPFPRASFDRVLCSFAIFLFSDLSSLLSECHRVLDSTGRIGLVYSAGEDRNWDWYDQLISRYGPAASLGTERYSPQYVETGLKHLGFTNVETRVEVHSLMFSNASEFWGWAWSHGDRGVLESLTGDHSKFKQELFEEIGKRAGAGLPYQVFGAITVGTKRRAD